MQDSNVKVDKSIFRAYDIRAVYGKTLDENIMKRIGAALGTFMLRRGMGKEVLIGNDIRESSPALSKAFIEARALASPPPTLASSTATLSVSSRSLELCEAGPSLPRATGIPRSSMRRSGAMPEARYILLTGQ